MIITSPSFSDGAFIPRKFSCEGGDINPELQIQNVPPEARSLALVVHDPDAPAPGGFVHWLVWNIHPGTVLIKEESIPPYSMEGSTTSGSVGYAGPCPPSGAAHHYHFRLYALDAVLDLAEGADIAEFTEAIKGHVIEEAELVGLYKKE